MNFADRTSTALTIAGALCLATSVGLAVRGDAPRAHAPAVLPRAVVPAPPVPEPVQPAAVATADSPDLPTRCTPYMARTGRAEELATDDGELARFLAIPFPTDLDFDADHGPASEASVERFGAWLAAKTELATKLTKRYERVVAHGSPVEVVAASERLGVVADTFANALFTSDIPADVRRGDDAVDKVDAYCDALTTAAEPLADQAVQRYSACVERARRYARVARGDRASEVLDAAEPCLDALEDVRPEQPRLEEIFTATAPMRQRIRFGLADGRDAGHDYDGEVERGVSHRTQGKLAQAHAAYARAIEIDPSRPEAYYDDGLLLLRQAEGALVEIAYADWERALERFREAAARATGDVREQAEERARTTQRMLTRVRELEDGNGAR